ncbi:MAG: hypothetical protein RL264_2172 [Bacteroidota bacterium]|jgi:uncharacterized protein YndB with AHSA1/START domain
MSTAKNMKEKYELEFLFKTNTRVLETMITTPDGLAEWFADDVNVNDDIYTFEWDGSSEEARIVNLKSNSKVRFHWISDEEEGLDTYFEISYSVDPLTSDVVVKVVDFAYPEDLESSKMLWEQQILDLKRHIGA